MFKIFGMFKAYFENVVTVSKLNYSALKLFCFIYFAATAVDAGRIRGAEAPSC